MNLEEDPSTHAISLTYYQNCAISGRMRMHDGKVLRQNIQGRMSKRWLQYGKLGLIVCLTPQKGKEEARSTRP
jgi:hypothetical protein